MHDLRFLQCWLYRRSSLRVEFPSGMYGPSFLQRWLCSAIIGGAIAGSLAGSVTSLCNAQQFAQQFPLQTAPHLAPPQLALPNERLMMEQTRDLSAAGQQLEAFKLLEKLQDEAENRLVPVQGSERAATLQTQRLIPLALWTSLQARALLERFPDTTATIQTQQREQASVALQQL